MKKNLIASLTSDKALMDIAKRRNHVSSMQHATVFPINANGRTILIGIDINPDKFSDLSLHAVAANGDEYISEGWSVRNKAAFVESAKQLFEKQLLVILDKSGFNEVDF